MYLSMAKYKVVNAVALATILAAPFTNIVVRADMCASGSKEVDGNWFCQPVMGIQYTNVGTAGTYKQITHMGSDGSCAHQPKNFAGPLAPLDEEVSLHLRGPLHLKQLAVYIPSSPKSERRVRRHNTKHVHRPGQHYHHPYHQGSQPIPENFDKEVDEVKRDMVTATIDDQVVSWVNNWSGSPTEETPTASPSPVMVTATIDGQVVSWVNTWFGPSTEAPSGPTAAPTPLMVTATIDGQIVSWIWSGATSTTTVRVASVTPAPGTPAAVTPAPGAPVQAFDTEVQGPAAISTSANPGPKTEEDWAAFFKPPPHPGFHEHGVFERIGYYDAASQTIDNLAFLGNFGGQGSGVFDYHFGASLSYVNCDGTGGAPSPQVLADKRLPSDSEVIVMLAEPCRDGSCGYVRPGAIAHHGFGGADKVFFMEFSMPRDGKTGFNGDMPAIWMLNAQIPRTIQYGNAECSCWESGCGEFDIAEALFDGSTYLKSTIHTNRLAGDSDYFERPTEGTMKLAVVFSANTSTLQIQVLPNSTPFPTSLSASQVNGLCEEVVGNRISHLTVS